MNRADVKELADLPIKDSGLFIDAVFYLKKMNRFLLNNALIYRFLKPFVKNGERISILDIGTGVGDIPQYLGRKLQKRKADFCITGIDVNPEVIRLAKSENANPRIDFICSNQLPAKTFDVAVVSQVLHHFSDDEDVGFLKELYGKVNRGIIISDLVRNRISYLLLKLVTNLSTKNSININDGPLSVAKSYSNREIRSIFKLAGISNYKMCNGFFPRKFVVVYK